MQKTVIAIILVMLLAIPLYAGQAAPNSCEIGPILEYFDYDEDLQPPHKSSESGPLGGVHAGYTYQAPQDLYVRVFLDLLGGRTDYDGSTQSGLPASATTDNFLSRFEVDFGYTFGAPGLWLTPYLGIGSRGWRRELGGYLPFDETYAWGYIPLGLRAGYEINPSLRIEAHMALHRAFGGSLCIEGSWLTADDSDLEVSDGHLLEIPVCYALSPGLELSLVPYYLFSSIRLSDPFLMYMYTGSITLAYEPGSTTHQSGVQLRLVYYF